MNPNLTPLRTRTDRQLVFTSSQAARYLGVSLATIRRWTDAGHITCYRTPGGQRRFSRDQLDDFIASMRGDAGGSDDAHAAGGRAPERGGHPAPLSSPAGRTSRAGAGRRTSPAAGRACPTSSAKRASMRAAGRDLADRAPVDGHVERLARAVVDRQTSSGATTSARALSECGAMNDDDEPSTPHAITGPPLARL